MEIESPPTDKPYDKSEGERRGILIINTGDGKGKSTAAFGLALRAHGRGKAVKIYQFMIFYNCQYFSSAGKQEIGAGKFFFLHYFIFDRSSRSRDSFQHKFQIVSHVFFAVF